MAQKQVEYYENGQKKYQEEKKDGQYVGKRIWWYENGKKQKEAYYDKEGVYWRKKEWSEDGQLIADQNLRKTQKQAGQNYLAQIQWVYNDKIGYYYLNEGDGDRPQAGSRVIMHYIGYLNNGKEFENSYTSATPLEFIVGRGMLLPAFEKAIASFRPGQKGYIKIPADLGYGEQPVGSIPPNAALNYYVEILEVN